MLISFCSRVSGDVARASQEMWPGLYRRLHMAELVSTHHTLVLSNWGKEEQCGRTATREGMHICVVKHKVKCKCKCK